jgi:hypothetical protein
MTKKTFLLQLLTVAVCFSSVQAQNAIIAGREAETLNSLAARFVSPPDAYKPHAWWHWLGTNYSEDGITRDLEAMKRAGVNGVVIFNAPTWLETGHTPWPEQTYRSPRYWEAFRHTLHEARRLGMEVGVHNTPGWSTTGGTWISPEEDGMKAATLSRLTIEGGRTVSVELPQPEGEYYKDVAVFAIPDTKTPSADDVQDISAFFANGRLEWQAPVGRWTVFRLGYFSTMQRSHPAPEDVEQTAFEADKMSLAATRKHWNNVLRPFQEKFADFIGTTFNYIWIDSYEAWGQSWTPDFRKEFISMKGYDPAPQIALAYARGDSILSRSTKGLSSPRSHFSPESRAFLADYREVVSRLFLRCWQAGRDMVSEAGFRLCFEPYGSIIAAPFDMEEGVGVADIPVTEFWVHSNDPSGGEKIAEAAARYQKRIVGAEAFTGMEATCRFTETPAMLKRPADMGFSYGVNMYFLHSWAHNPFDDRYQPGWGFAHYGTHFSRNQTWIEPSKAFFAYIARCQMLLQQGDFRSRNDSVLHRRTPDADIFFVRNTGNARTMTIDFPVAGRTPELWDAYSATISKTDFSPAESATRINLSMERDQSIFVVFPAQPTHYAKLPVTKTVKETETVLGNSWKVTFIPKTPEKQFSRTLTALADFSQSADDAVKYFSGTAVYETVVRISAADMAAGRRVVIDLGKVADLAALEINGCDAGVLWMAPFEKDITGFLKKGSNTLKIKVTNTWVNRLIGDEQFPEDFEWTDHNQGLRAMRRLPDWFIRNEPRPESRRKTFTPWYYYRKDSRLVPAGLLGPVRILKQQIEQQ